MKRYLILSTLLLSGAAFANEVTTLLPAEVVERAVEEHPLVQAGIARGDAARGAARDQRVGPYEFIVGGSYAKRRVDREGEFNEYDMSLQRGFRLPGKAALDRRAGEFGIVAADFRIAGARHGAVLLLNDIWWDWLAAGAEVKANEAAVANLSADLASVERRVALQDAAPVDSDRARAALATARVALDQSRSRAQIARSRLEVQFPSLSLPAEVPDLPDPVMPPIMLDILRDQALAQDHGMAIARAEADRQTILAERARRDRIADPTLGVRLFSERGGAERGIGVVASVPIGGARRSAYASQANAEARAATAEFVAARFTAEEAAATNFAQAINSWTAWQRSVDARTSSEQAAYRLRQGYRLGGVDLTDLLYAERQAQEALKAETAARAEASRAISRLRINAHDLWYAGHRTDGP